MEQTFKTMEKVLEQISVELEESNFQAVKTLINTYQFLLPTRTDKLKDDLVFSKMLEDQKVLLEGLYIKANDIIWKELENKNYKFAHTLTYVADTFKKSSRNIDYLLSDLKRQSNLPQNRKANEVEQLAIFSKELDKAKEKIIKNY